MYFNGRDVSRGTTYWSVVVGCGVPKRSADSVFLSFVLFIIAHKSIIRYHSVRRLFGMANKKERVGAVNKARHSLSAAANLSCCGQLPFCRVGSFCDVSVFEHRSSKGMMR